MAVSVTGEATLRAYETVKQCQPTGVNGRTSQPNIKYETRQLIFSDQWMRFDLYLGRTELDYRRNANVLVSF